MLESFHKEPQEAVAFISYVAKKKCIAFLWRNFAEIDRVLGTLKEVISAYAFSHCHAVKAVFFSYSKSDILFKSQNKN